MEGRTTQRHSCGDGNSEKVWEVWKQSVKGTEGKTKGKMKQTERWDSSGMRNKGRKDANN